MPPNPQLDNWTILDRATGQPYAHRIFFAYQHKHTNHILSLTTSSFELCHPVRRFFLNQHTSFGPLGPFEDPHHRTIESKATPNPQFYFFSSVPQKQQFPLAFFFEEGIFFSSAPWSHPLTQIPSFSSNHWGFYFRSQDFLARGRRRPSHSTCRSTTRTAGPTSPSRPTPRTRRWLPQSSPPTGPPYCCY